MKKKLLLFLANVLALYGWTQDCPELLSPVDGSNNVPVDATITWERIEGIPSYRILLGTTPGASDIIGASVGSATTYDPPLGLPENTEIFVTIVLDFFQGQTDIFCEGQSFRTEDVTVPPNCTELRLPANEATDVSVFTNISWFYAPGATSYDVIIGTAPGSGNIANTNAENLSFNPTNQLPENRTIYIQIIPRNENGLAVNCSEYTFETRELAPLPDCTSLLQPLNGDENVALTPLLEWSPIPGAIGYKVTIGSTPTSSDVLENAVFSTNSTFVIDFEPNRTFFITIVPFNESGDAIGCEQESFSTLLGCGPFLDMNLGEFVSLSPNLEFPGIFSFCENAEPLILNAPSGADGYRWYSIDQFGNESLRSEETEFPIEENGIFYLEAYNIISQPGGTIECPTIFDFNVVSSEIATINNLDIRDTALGLEITVNASGIGDYEYAIDDIDGPFQESNVFRNVTPGTHTIFVRDKNGCGIVQETFEQDLTFEGFPKFFTPNGDNNNEFWQFRQPIEGETIVFVSIEIYDRYGRLLQQISQNSLGWDGTVNGRPLPAGGYWFRAIEEDGNIFKGNFTLKR